MGLTHVTVAVRVPGTDAAVYEALFLVDTGATDSLAPAAELERIGVHRVGRMTYELADGTLEEFDFGLAQIEFMGEVTAGRILFGPERAEPILGVTAPGVGGDHRRSRNAFAEAPSCDPAQVDGAPDA